MNQKDGKWTNLNDLHRISERKLIYWVFTREMCKEGNRDC